MQMAARRQPDRSPVRPAPQLAASFAVASANQLNFAPSCLGTEYADALRMARLVPTPRTTLSSPSAWPPSSRFTDVAAGRIYARLIAAVIGFVAFVWGSNTAYAQTVAINSNPGIVRLNADGDEEPARDQTLRVNFINLDDCYNCFAIFKIYQNQFYW